MADNNETSDEKPAIITGSRGRVKYNGNYIRRHVARIQATHDAQRGRGQRWKEVTVDSANPTQRETPREQEASFMDMLTPEEQAKINEKNAKKEEKKNTASFKRSYDDLVDDDKDPDNKFEIKEGDIIDFMFKEIVLASANWAGTKAFNAIGYGGYKIGSGIYHGSGKGCKWLGKEIKECFSKRTSEDEKAIKDGDDKTTVFAKTVFAARDNQMDVHKLDFNDLSNSDSNTKKNIDIIFKKLKQNKTSELVSASEYQAMTEEQKKKVSLIIPDSLKKGLLSIPQEAVENKKFQSFIKNKIEETLVAQATENAVAANYAAAMMLREGLSGPDNLSGDINDYNQRYKQLLQEGRKSYYVGLLDGKKPEDLLKLSDEAYEKEKKAAQEGNYKEKKKDLYQQPANMSLIELENLNNNEQYQTKSAERVRQIFQERQLQEAQNLQNATTDNVKAANIEYGQTIRDMAKEDLEENSKVDIKKVVEAIKNGEELPDNIPESYKLLQEKFNAFKPAEKLSDKEKEKFITDIVKRNQKMEQFCTQYTAAKLLNTQNTGQGEELTDAKMRDCYLDAQEIFYKSVKGDIVTTPEKLLSNAESAYNQEINQLKDIDKADDKSSRYAKPQSYKKENKGLEAIDEAFLYSSKEDDQRPQGLREAADGIEYYYDRVYSHAQKELEALREEQRQNQNRRRRNNGNDNPNDTSNRNRNPNPRSGGRDQ